MNKEWMAYKGMEVVAPQHFVYIKDVCCDFKVSKWEKRRNKLVYKLKRRKALFNWFAKWAIIILLAPVTGSLWIMLLALFQTQLNAVLIGIIIPMTWICTYYIVDSWFETDSDWVKVKHKGCVY